jgi:predicted nucleotide-binding protein
MRSRTHNHTNHQVRLRREPSTLRHAVAAAFTIAIALCLSGCLFAYDAPHGHSEAALEKLEEHLRSIGVEPVILSRREESAQSLFQKFMAVASKAEFAVVLLSSDDYGASRRQYDADGVGDRALQFRARQNVILELGFFYGQLGWENVFVLVEEPDRVFPNFERPSDLDGVVFDEMSRPNWRASLTAKLVAAGFEMPGEPSES